MNRTFAILLTSSICFSLGFVAPQADAAPAQAPAQKPAAPAATVLPPAAVQNPAAVTTVVLPPASAQSPSAATTVVLPPAVNPVYLDMVAEDANVRLYRNVPSGMVPNDDVRTPVDSEWQEVCGAPCRLRLDPRFEYYIGGRGISSSKSFQLAPNQPYVRVYADSTRIATRIVGWVSFGVGISVGIVGVALASMDSLTSGAHYDSTSSSTSASRSDSTSSGLRTTGIVLGAGGFTAALIGLLYGISGTSYTISPLTPVGTARLRLSPSLELGPTGLVF